MDRDFAFGTASLFISVGYYWTASLIPESQLADAIGPQGLPTIYATLLAVLSLLLMGRSLRARARLKPDIATAAAPPTPETGTMVAEPGPKRTATEGARRAAGTLLIGVFYIVTVAWLGYVVSLAGLIFATIRYQDRTVGRQAFIVAVSGAVLCWVLFVWLMRIPQPRGLWLSLL